MNDIEQAQLTLLNNGIPIIVKSHVTNADITPCYQVIVYSLFTPVVKHNDTNNDNSQPKGGIWVS